MLGLFSVCASCVLLFSVYVIRGHTFHHPMCSVCVSIGHVMCGGSASAFSVCVADQERHLDRAVCSMCVRDQGVTP